MQNADETMLCISRSYYAKADRENIVCYSMSDFVCVGAMSEYALYLPTPKGIIDIIQRAPDRTPR